MVNHNPELVPTLVMTLQEVMRTAFFAAAAVFLFTLIAEALHLRRIRSCAFLTFGPSGRYPVSVIAAAVMRVFGLSIAVWGFAVLACWFGTYEPKFGAGNLEKNKDPHHVVFVLDVSPSMLFSKDAGPEKNISRLERAEALYRSVIDRIRGENSLYSVIAFWKDAKIVVCDTPDLNICDNIFSGLPLTYAMQSGGEKTALPESVGLAAQIAKNWEPHSATLIFLTDGDVVPEKNLVQLPPAYDNLLVFGVGDPVKGSFIDDHFSRQARTGLTDLAARYGGTYFNANEQLPGTEFFSTVRAVENSVADTPWNLRKSAVLCIIIGTFLFAAVTPMLTFFAGRWNRRAGRQGGATS